MATSLRPLILVSLAGLAWMSFGIYRALVVRHDYEAGIPEHLRADRWELTPEGQTHRARVTHRCGDFPEGAWLQERPGQLVPEIRGAAGDYADCAREALAGSFDEASFGSP